MSDSNTVDIKVGDLYLAHNDRLWVVSAVYDTQVAMRYSSDRAPLERIFWDLNILEQKRIYRQVGNGNSDDSSNGNNNG